MADTFWRGTCSGPGKLCRAATVSVLVFGPGPAMADWALDGTLSQQLLADSNADLDPDVSDSLLTISLDAGLILSTDTQRAGM